MDEVADEDVDLEAEEPEEDEILADLEKEYESEDLTGKHIHSPQLAKLLNKMFRNRLPDKLLKEKLERQARPENCDTAKTHKGKSRHLAKAPWAHAEEAFAAVQNQASPS